MQRKNVKEIRKSLGLTQEELAQCLGVNLRTVARWETTAFTPRGSALMALNQLEASRGKGDNRVLHVGICPDFTDTSLPLLLTRLVEFPDLDLPPIQFVPIPWDDHCLEAITHGTIQVALYNDYCVRRFQERTVNGLARIGGDLESGSFYVALYLPVSYRLRLGEQPDATQLLDLLWQPETVKIIPSADMQVNFLLLRDVCASRGNKIAKESVPESWLSVTPAAGLSLLLQMARLFPDQPIAYVGGQDQRVVIEQMNALEPQPRFQLLTDFSAVGWQPPRSLRLNCLFAHAGLRLQSVDNIWEAILRVRSAVRVNAVLKDAAFLELRRWHNLFGGGANQNYDQHIRRVCHLSPEVKLWFS